MDLSPVVVEWISSLNMNKRGGRHRPHKPALLLAVAKLVEFDYVRDRRVYFDPMLFEFFEEYWHALAEEEDDPGRIEYPFWYMDSEPFWRLVPHPEHQLTVRQRREKARPASPKQIRDWIQYAELESAFWDTLCDAEARKLLQNLILRRYNLTGRAAAVEQVEDFERSVYEYSQTVLMLAEHAYADSYHAADKPVRDAAFRRLVTEAYDYTCAVTGIRLSLVGDPAFNLVEAAHIQDWSDSHDDRPANGIALRPDIHLLFDQGLFTLDNRLRLVKSKRLQDAIGAVGFLDAFHQQPIRLPADPAFHPDERCLQRHREKHGFRL